jgi:hypothetical protein
VVGTQDVSPGDFQVPEPWAGHLDVAPLLFVSSNPSISGSEPYPPWSASSYERQLFFMERFGPGAGQVKDGVYTPLQHPRADGRLHGSRPVPFWNICKRNAAWLFGRKVEPGTDYAMTEVVHCKSRKEIGVAAARDHCADRWLDEVLTTSAARLVVILGDQAHTAFIHLGVEPLAFWSPVEVAIGGRTRLVLLARHPNYRGRRRWQDHIDDAAFLLLQSTLNVPGQT